VKGFFIMVRKPKIMKVDFDRESWPFFYYWRLAVTGDPLYLNLNIDPGFYYCVQRSNARWSSQNANLPGAFANPPRIEAYHGNSVFQLVPFDISLMSSPGESGVAVDMVTPARPMTAVQLDRSKALEILLTYRDVLCVKLSNMTVVAVPAAADFSLPSYFDLLLMGRMYPALEQESWGST
jgi:hypothetical protein